MESYTVKSNKPKKRVERCFKNFQRDSYILSLNKKGVYSIKSNRWDSVRRLTRKLLTDDDLTPKVSKAARHFESCTYALPRSDAALYGTIPVKEQEVYSKCKNCTRVFNPKDILSHRDCFKAPPHFNLLKKKVKSKNQNNKKPNSNGNSSSHSTNSNSSAVLLSATFIADPLKEFEYKRPYTPPPLEDKAVLPQLKVSVAKIGISKPSKSSTLTTSTHTSTTTTSTDKTSSTVSSSKMSSSSSSGSHHSSKSSSGHHSFKSPSSSSSSSSHHSSRSMSSHHSSRSPSSSRHSSKSPSSGHYSPRSASKSSHHGSTHSGSSSGGHHSSKSSGVSKSTAMEASTVSSASSHHHHVSSNSSHSSSRHRKLSLSGSSKRSGSSSTGRSGSNNSSSTSSRSSSSSKTVPKNYDPDIHCGVVERNRGPCMRSITCSNHRLHLRKQVSGRSKDIHQLIAERKTAKENDLKHTTPSCSYTPPNGEAKDVLSPNTTYVPIVGHIASINIDTSGTNSLVHIVPTTSSNQARLSSTSILSKKTNSVHRKGESRSSWTLANGYFKQTKNLENMVLLPVSPISSVSSVQVIKVGNNKISLKTPQNASSPLSRKKVILPIYSSQTNNVKISKSHPKPSAFSNFGVRKVGGAILHTSPFLEDMAKKLFATIKLQLETVEIQGEISDDLIGDSKRLVPDVNGYILHAEAPENDRSQHESIIRLIDQHGF